MPRAPDGDGTPPARDRERGGHVSLLCGISAGVAQAGVFNPYDRALYLSVKNKVPFLSWENFRNPYLGFGQSIAGRALSGGLYFPLERMFKSMVNGGSLEDFLAGTAAGACNAAILNPISAVKYKTWGRDANRGVLHEAAGMYRKGGLRPFANGLLPTLLRDVTFGGCYTYLRLRMRGDGVPADAANMAAAAAATVASGPFNLARNLQYATKSRAAPRSVTRILARLAARTRDHKTLSGRLHYLQRRLRIGWGTARVAAGITFGQKVYDLSMSKFSLDGTEL